MTPTINRSKTNRFLPSEQVKEILKSKGFSKVFNYSDYNHYKEKVNNAFNKVQAIAQLFIEENTISNQSDYKDYIF